MRTRDRRAVLGWLKMGPRTFSRPAVGVESLGYIAISGCSLNTWKQEERLISSSADWLFLFVSADTVRDCGRYLKELRKSLIDEDEGDEEGKDLLGKRGDVADEEAALCSHNDQDDEDEPETDPHSTSQVLKVVSLTELQRKTQIC